MPQPQALTNSYSRVWFQSGGPGPSRPIAYQGNWKAGAPSWAKGDLTTIWDPDPNAYGKFVRTGRFRGEPGNPELSITARYTRDRSVLLKAARADCAHSLQIHMGTCQNPQDFKGGWDKIAILEEASITNYGGDELGAMGPGETAPINEEVPFSGTDYYEVMPINFSEQAASLVTREILSVYICDAEQCGACGVPSDGCQVVFALEGAVSGSPGQSPTLIVTSNGGASYSEVPISTLLPTEAGTAVLCIGTYTVVLSADSESLHYALTADVVLGTPTWTEVTTGFVVSAGPLAAYSNGASDTWIVGEGGYIYHTTDPTTGVTVSNAGVATTQDLNDVHFFDPLHGVAVGGSNAVVYTTDGGVTWAALTGPAVGVVLNTVWMHGIYEWLVGTAGGSLYYTVNGGSTWTEVTFPGSGAGQVYDIVFVTPSVGYMAHATATPAGRILRTLNGGNTWYVLPEKSSGSMPTNARIAELAVCGDPNIVYGGGLSAGVDGILVKGA